MDVGISKCLESQATMIRQILPNVANTESQLKTSQILKKKETAHFKSPSTKATERFTAGKRLSMRPNTNVGFFLEENDFDHRSGTVMGHAQPSQTV